MRQDQPSGVGGQFRKTCLQHIGARVAGAVDAVAEAHQPLAVLQCPFDPALRPVRGADGIKHVQHRPGRAAMQRALEGSHGADDGRSHVRARRGNDSGGEGGGVETVIENGHEIAVDRCRRLCIRCLARQHAQHVFRAAQAEIGHHRGKALADPPACGQKHRQAAAQHHGIFVRPFAGQCRKPQPHQLIGAELRRGGLQHGQGAGRRGTGLGKAGRQLRAARHAQNIGPEEAGCLLVGELSGEVFDGSAAQHQPSAFAVHFTEDRGGSGDAI